MTPRIPPADPLAVITEQMRRQTRIMARGGTTPEAYPITERRPTQGKENISAGVQFALTGPGWDWTIYRTGISLGAGASAGLTISNADTYDPLPSWGSSFDSVFLYPARNGLYTIRSSAKVGASGTCEAFHRTGFSDHELVMRQSVVYEHVVTIPLAQEGTSSGFFDFIPMPEITNRSSGTRTFELIVEVEPAVLF